MPMQWNDHADARLFANVLKLHVVKLDYPALAKSMGEGVTPKAISHRISKIKEKALLHRAERGEISFNNAVSMLRKRSSKSKGYSKGFPLEMDDDPPSKLKVKAEEDQTATIKMEKFDTEFAPPNAETPDNCEMEGTPKPDQLAASNNPKHGAWYGEAPAYYGYPAQLQPHDQVLGNYEVPSKEDTTMF
ncbi:hypothetical protein RUND412_006969 [Rhizina undulata]